MKKASTKAIPIFRHLFMTVMIIVVGFGAAILCILFGMLNIIFNYLVLASFFVVSAVALIHGFVKRRLSSLNLSI
jgi:hypothetical protein